jgi:LysR family hydrogen peroxide-inducible transcriptional activator
MGVTLIPEMAAAVETRSATVSVARFKDPQPSRTIGMIWRKTSPLAGQLLQLSQVVCGSSDALRKAGQSGIGIAQSKSARNRQRARGDIRR